MEKLVEVIGEGYVIVTLACVIIGYLVTTTPYLSKLKGFVPVLVTVIGSVLGVILYGVTVEVVISGALAGIVSTGLYELFGKGIKNLGYKLEEKGENKTGGDE